ncbi:hypothetical protein D3C72_728940 [compost metagenome]
MNTSTTATFKATIIPFTHADSFVPLINTKDIKTMMNTAGKLIIPETTVPSASVAVSKGDMVIDAGK